MEQPIKLYPRCHPYDPNSETPVVRKQKAVAYSARGWFMPCCWLDDIETDQIKEFGLLDDDIKVENVDKLEQIFLSRQWVHFHKMLVEHPENAPDICKNKCSFRFDK